MSKIGFFDAGLGGLLVVREVERRLPSYDLVYFGDNGTSSYGSRSKEDMYSLAQRAVDVLLGQNCELIIITSNTATALALHDLQQTYLPGYSGNARALGVIIPAVEQAVARTYNGNIGVIASDSTIRSGVFRTEAHKLRPGVRIYQQACPMLVPLIETGQQNGASMRALLRTYLAPLQAANIDTLILGCAQYSLISHQVSELLGPRVRLIDEATVASDRLVDYLSHHPEIERRLEKNGQRLFFCSSLKSFAVLAPTFYGSQIEATQVTL
jgi:glutamate racemase